MPYSLPSVADIIASVKDIPQTVKQIPASLHEVLLATSVCKEEPGIPFYQNRSSSGSQAGDEFTMRESHRNHAGGDEESGLFSSTSSVSPTKFPPTMTPTRYTSTMAPSPSTSGTSGTTWGMKNPLAMAFSRYHRTRDPESGTDDQPSLATDGKGETERESPEDMV